MRVYLPLDDDLVLVAPNGTEYYAKADETDASALAVACSNGGEGVHVRRYGEDSEGDLYETPDSESVVLVRFYVL